MKTLPPQIKRITDAWPMLSNIIFVPHSEQEYDQLVRLLDTLIDMVGENEQHPLASLMDILGTLIEKYEDEHVPEITKTLVQTVEFQTA